MEIGKTPGRYEMRVDQKKLKKTTIILEIETKLQGAQGRMEATENSIRGIEKGLKTKIKDQKKDV